MNCHSYGEDEEGDTLNLNYTFQTTSKYTSCKLETRALSFLSRNIKWVVIVLSRFERRYGSIPRVSEGVVDSILSEVRSFTGFLKHDPQEARRLVEEDLNWLKENNPYLARIIRAAINSALDLYSNKLTHADWIELELLLLKGVLLVLQTINEALKANSSDH